MSQVKTMELVLSFHLFVGSGHQAQVAGFCSKCLGLLSHPTLALDNCAVSLLPESSSWSLPNPFLGEVLTP